MDKKTLILIIIGLLGTVLFIIFEMARRKKLKKYWSRSCTGPEWVRRFPQCHKDKIRDFLGEFTESFMFRKKNILKFSPKDKIIDVYKALYPIEISDALELETFIGTIEKKYGLDLSKINPDVTLGDLFELVINKNPDFLVSL